MEQKYNYYAGAFIAVIGLEPFYRESLFNMSLDVIPWLQTFAPLEFNSIISYGLFLMMAAPFLYNLVA